MSCTPFSPTPFVPITDISQVQPHFILSGLTLSNLKSCNLYNSQNKAFGYCNLTNCYQTTLPKSEAINCSYLLLIANLYQYIANELECSFTQTSIQNTSIVNSNQVIIISMYNTGSITNTTIQNQQSTNVNVNIINIQSSQNQTKISSLITQCIQNVIQYAKQNPSVFQSPNSANLVSSLSNVQPSSLSNTTQQATQNVIQNITSASSSIQSSETVFQEQIIKIVISNVQYPSAVIDINQSDAVSLLTQNIAVATVNTILPQLYPSIIPQPSSSPSSSPSSESSPSSDRSSTISHSLSSVDISIIVIVVVVVIIIIIVVILMTTHR